MATPERQVIVCQSFRTAGDKKGICHKQTDGFLQYLEEEIVDRGIDAVVSSTGCLKMCEKGPVVVVYPQAWWYSEVDEGKLDQILDALEEGEPAKELLAA